VQSKLFTADNTTASVFPDNTTVSLDQVSGSGSGAESNTERKDNIKQTLPTITSNTYSKRDIIVHDDEIDEDKFIVNAISDDSENDITSGEEESSSTTNDVANNTSPIIEQINQSLANMNETKETTGDALMEDSAEQDTSGSGSPWDGSSGYGFGSADGDKREAISQTGVSGSNTTSNQTISKITATQNQSSEVVDNGSGSNNDEEGSTSFTKNNKVIQSFQSSIENANEKLNADVDSELKKVTIESESGSGSGRENNADKKVRVAEIMVITHSGSESGSGSGSFTEGENEDKNDIDIEQVTPTAEGDNHKVKKMGSKNTANDDETFGSAENTEGENDHLENNNKYVKNNTTNKINKKEQKFASSETNENTEEEEEEEKVNKEFEEVDMNSNDSEEEGSAVIETNNTNNFKNKTDNLENNTDNKLLKKPFPERSVASNFTIGNNKNTQNLAVSVDKNTPASSSDDTDGGSDEGSADDDSDEKESTTDLSAKRSKIIEEIVTDMAKAAIQSVEVDDANTVVKKSNIDIPEFIDQRSRRSKTKTKQQFESSPKSNEEKDVALKELVHSILKEDPSVRQNIEKLSKKRKEDEEKLSKEIVSFIQDESSISDKQSKSQVKAGIKDFEGYAQALMQADSLTPFKHNLIAKKLEQDLLNRLSIPEQNQKLIAEKEDTLLQDSELEFIKDKIAEAAKSSEEYAVKHHGNIEDVRKHAIASLHPIIDALPLKREDIDGLAKSISKSAWLKTITHTKKDDSTTVKVRRNLDELLNLS